MKVHRIWVAVFFACMSTVGLASRAQAVEGVDMGQSWACRDEEGFAASAGWRPLSVGFYTGRLTQDEQVVVDMKIVTMECMRSKKTGKITWISVEPRAERGVTVYSYAHATLFGGRKTYEAAAQEVTEAIPQPRPIQITMPLAEILSDEAMQKYQAGETVKTSIQVYPGKKIGHSSGFSQRDGFEIVNIWVNKISKGGGIFVWEDIR